MVIISNYDQFYIILADFILLNIPSDMKCVYILKIFSIYILR